MNFISIRDIKSWESMFDITIDACTGHLEDTIAKHNASGLAISQKSACGCVHVSMYAHANHSKDHFSPCDYCDGYQATQGNHSIEMCDMHFRHMNNLINAAAEVV